MQEFLARPGFIAPYGTMGADISFILALIFTSLFMVGWYRARRGEGQAHHVITLWAMLAMLSYFIWYYLSRELGVLAFEGKEGFGGPEEIYRMIFGPLLTIHILVVSVGIVLAVYMIFLGYRTSMRSGPNRHLRAGPPTTGSGMFSLWTVVATIAATFVFFVIRALSKGFSMRLFIAWATVCGVVGLLVIAVEWIGRAIYSDGQRRHRAMGTFTMVLYLIALFTSAATYAMLYVIWMPKIG